jgi:hypothetical protein
MTLPPTAGLLHSPLFDIDSVTAVAMIACWQDDSLAWVPAVKTPAGGFRAGNSLDTDVWLTQNWGNC